MPGTEVDANGGYVRYGQWYVSCHLTGFIVCSDELKILFREFPGGPVIRTQHSHSTAGALVRSLVGELRSHKAGGAAKKKKKKILFRKHYSVNI